jgi:uncharacterized protein YodC (DUF2158 family)
MAVGGVFDPGKLTACIPDEGFRAGNVVLLKSGGPTMTVADVFLNGNIQCVWFADRESKHDAFRAPELIKVAE